MSNIQVGKTVKHIDYNFTGIVKELLFSDTQALIVLTHGEHPNSEGKDTYIACVDNLEVIEPANASEQLIEDVTREFLLSVVNNNNEDENDTVESLDTDDDVVINTNHNGMVVVDTEEGSTITFEHYLDFVNFMEISNNK